MASEWKQLGLQLGVPNHRLLQIQANNQHSPDFAQECLTDMFHWWLNNGHNVKHKRLASALIAIGKESWHNSSKKMVESLTSTWWTKLSPWIPVRREGWLHC